VGKKTKGVAMKLPKGGGGEQEIGNSVREVVEREIARVQSYPGIGEGSRL